MTDTRILICSLFISLLCSCAGKTDSPSLSPSEPQKIVCDESKIVLHSLPMQVIMVNDSTIATITNRRQLSWYNILDGRNTGNFGLSGLSLDSLVDATYNVKYAGRRNYRYSASESGGLNNTGYQVSDFAIDNDHYYVYFNCEVEVRYLSDTSAVNEKMNDPKMKDLKEKNPESEIHFMEYVEFMLVLNSDRSFNNIVPLYRRKVLGKEFPSYQLGFAAYQGSFYVPLSINFTAESYRKPFGDEPFSYSFCKLGIQDTSSGKLLLSSKEMDYSSLTLNRYLDRRSFQITDEGLYICNGKDIININNSEKINGKEIVGPSEWISNFYIDKERLFLRTVTLVAKAHPNEMEVAYGIDSIAGRSLVLIDRSNGRKKVVPITTKEIGAGALVKDQLIYFERDKTNYYLTRLRLDEK